MGSNILNIDEIINGSYLTKHSDLINHNKIANYIEDISVSHPDDDIVIYKSNNWEFTYYEDKLYMICIYSRGIKDSFYKSFFESSIADFYEYLTTHKLSWKLEDKFKADGQFQISVSSGCNVIVDSGLLKIDQIFLMVGQ